MLNFENGINSIAPFTTSHKATCGYFFDKKAFYGKKQAEINPVNFSKWRKNDQSSLEKVQDKVIIPSGKF